MRNFLVPVLTVLAEHADRRPEQISPYDHLADSNDGDFDWEELFMLLEDTFKIKIGDREEARIKIMSVDELNLFIDKKKAVKRKAN